jgi:alanine racemase
MISKNEPTIALSDTIRPTHIEVNLARIKSNYEKIQAKVGSAEVMPVIKANAYGHGLLTIGKFYQDIGATRLAVAYLEEALLLRKNGITIPILVLGGILHGQIPEYIENDITITASSIEKLGQVDQVAAQMQKIAKIHLKIDTGMERIGVHYYNAQPFIEESLKYNNVIIEGVFSHFANSDAVDLTHANLQFERFMEATSFYEKNSLPTPKLHIANSAAILQMPQTYLDIVRPGIILFGVYPSQETQRTIDVEPTLSWVSSVVYFKVTKPNHPISYGSSWQTDHDTRIVTLPVGYGDGYFRTMSNRSQVIIHDKKYNTVGRICMDQTMVNIEQDSAYNGDRVILIGESASQKITCEDLAQWANTIPYEILTNINTRVPRVYCETI